MYQVQKVGEARQIVWVGESSRCCVVGDCVTGVFKQCGENPSLRSKLEQL